MRLGRIIFRLGGARGLRAATRARGLLDESRRRWQRLRRRAERLTTGLRRLPPPPAETVLLVGYIDGDLGLGQSLRGLARSLATTSIDFAIRPFGIGIEGRRSAPFMPERYDTGTRSRAVTIVEVAGNELATVRTHLSHDIFDRSYTILRTYWELSRAPEEWQAALAGIDEIWAPNRFVADAFRPIFGGVISIVPPCVEIGPPPLVDRSRFSLQEGRHHFLFSFDYFSYPARKNPLGLVEAFRLAFPSGTEEVGLVLKSTSAEGQSLGVKAAIGDAAAGDPRIRVIDERLSREDMMALMAACDAYVSLHRAEGFGLGMAEAMLLGKPVVATDYSGSVDFLNEATGYPVRHGMRPLEAGDYVWWEGQVWAEPDAADAARAMRACVADREEALRRAQAGRRGIETAYGAVAVGQVAELRLREIFAALAEGTGSGRSGPPASRMPKV